ncbi:hypothetical protein AGR7B_pAt0020 [Agrobacterium deltaense RV3]|nr:hypothetical protein AGR7B_pAt0020 [Agrobacterium deltaense RV3]
MRGTSDLDPKPINLAPEHRLEVRFPDDPQRPQVFSINPDGKIFEDALLRDDAFTLAIAGHVGDTGPCCILKGVDRHHSVGIVGPDLNITAEWLNDTRDRADKGILSLPIEARNTDDRAFGEIEIERHHGRMSG